MITQTRVKSGKPAQKIGYASVKPIMSDTDYSVQTAAPSRPFKQDPIGRLGFSISCGFYNDGWSYFVSPSLSLVEYPATGVTKHYRADLQLLKLSFLDTYQTKLSASSPALSSDILYARAAATMLDFMHGRDLTAFYYGSHPYTDRAANEFYPLGIPVFRIKRYPYFQENPFTSGLFSGYSDSYFISNDTAFSPLIPENTDPNCVGLYTTVTTNFVYASPSPTSGWLTVDMLTDTRFINGVLPNAYAGVDDYTFSRHNMSCSMPPYYVTRPPYYFNDLNKRGFSIHASAEGSAGSIDGDIYSTYDDNNGGYIVVSPTAAVCYKVSSTPEDPLKYAYRLNSPIDGIMRTCFGVDLSTNSLFFRDTYDTLTVLGVEQVTDVAFDRSAHPAVQYNVAYYQSGTDKKIIDNKKPVFEWFMPIHDALPAKSSAVAGQLIPEIFYKNCTKQKFNIRLDLLEVDSSQFIDGHGCVVITNPGVFINANNAEVTPAICFCNFELNSGDDINNLFVEIAYFPHVQYHVDAIAPDLLDNVTLLDKSNYIYFLESYYDTFDKIGKYVKQVRPLDTSYIEFVDYGESYGGPYHFAYNDLIPKGDFTDYYSSGFNVYILGEHLAPEDIPDIDNVDLSGFSILYSSNPIPKNVYFLANFSEKINSRLKQFNYTYLFPGYDSASEGDTFTYSASLYSSPEIDMCPDTGPLKYYSKNGLFSSKLEPFYHFMCSKVSTHIPIGFQQDMPIELGVNQTPYIYNPPLVIDYFPFQLS